MRENKQIDTDKIWEEAKIESERDFNYPYKDFRGKEKGVDDEKTGQALRGAFCQGYVQGVASRENKWISVKEKIPVNRDIVLVTNVDSKHKDDQWVCAGEINENGEWCNQFNSDDTIIVTHWMPLPEPPPPQSK